MGKIVFKTADPYMPDLPVVNTYTESVHYLICLVSPVGALMYWI